MNIWKFIMFAIAYPFTVISDAVDLITLSMEIIVALPFVIIYWIYRLVTSKFDPNKLTFSSVYNDLSITGPRKCNASTYKAFWRTRNLTRNLLDL